MSKKKEEEERKEANVKLIEEAKYCTKEKKRGSIWFLFFFISVRQEE